MGEGWRWAKGEGKLGTSVIVSTVKIKNNKINGTNSESCNSETNVMLHVNKWHSVQKLKRKGY